MKWSQLKKRIEANFADSVVGRVEVWNTRYRKSHDAEGEAWITIDKQRVSTMGTCTYFVELEQETRRKVREYGAADFDNPDQREARGRAYWEAEKIVNRRGHFRLEDVNRALFDSLGLSIGEAIKSANPIIRAFATLDRRFGKRRLAEFNDSSEHPLVRSLYQFRCEASGIETDRHSAGHRPDKA